MSSKLPNPVLITGGNGFIGQHLISDLSSKGLYIVNFSSHSNIETKNNMTSIVGDIRDKVLLEKVFKKYNPQYVIHLAAKATVEEGQENPQETFDININGTVNILELSRVYSPEKIIVLSTVHVYGENPNLPLKESYFPQPSRPYETSKACADIIAQSYAENFGLPIDIPRFVNVYGPGDLNFSRLIPKVVRDILFEEKITIWHGNISRDYLWIGDAIAAFDALLKKGNTYEKNRIINFGRGEPIRISEIVRKIIKISEKKNIHITTDADFSRKDEIKSLYVSSDKAKRLLKWTPITDIDEGLSLTFKWYKDYFQK